ncbi:hypothetical protein M409DRAFT_27059 [Zasmidium cellare ATCC 36951]|uniref:Uncharacterized protein n=1 Tax=Zasmidium cellare ATCC 36951 TaxID=1080233 RepID=A0A6A6C5Z1_ZASCE|nr:uncharacterized protein M409DRAFT_27059 [Zasmidium cellare ATCC 36951]KAF2162435.1 hypothetical protein M409DRAFT_27059 [Zasmidium cellare ATCC 36951]
MDGFDFDPNMFANFDFSDFMDTEPEQNDLQYHIPDAPFDQATDGWFNELDAPTQFLDGVAAPPPSPLGQDTAMSESAMNTSEPGFGPCVWCDAPHDTDHDPDCALLLGSDNTAAAGGGEAAKSDDGHAVPSLADFSPELTILTPAGASAPGFALFTPAAAPTPTTLPALPTYVSPYSRSPHPIPSPYPIPAWTATATAASQPALPALGSPHARSPYPMPASIPSTIQKSLPVRSRAPAPKTRRKEKTPAAQSPEPSHDERLEYQNLFNGFDAARQALVQPVGVDRLIPLNLTNDDWQQIKSHHIGDSGARIFNAIHAEPGAPPENFTDDQTVYYYEHQDIVRQSVLNKIHADPAKAEARAMMLLEEVINVHEHGVPKSVWERRDLKSGYLLESELICSQRLAEVIKAVYNDKYVALDVLSGTGLADLARSPARYLRRKHENCRVNARKAFEKLKAEEAKRNSVAPSKTPAAPAPRATKKSPKGKQPAQDLSPRTPTPSGSAAQKPLDQTLHQQYAQTGETSRPQLKRKTEADVSETLKRFKYNRADGE